MTENEYLELQLGDKILAGDGVEYVIVGFNNYRSMVIAINSKGDEIKIHRINISRRLARTKEIVDLI